MSKEKLKNQQEMLISPQVMRRAEIMQEAFEERQRANEVRDENREIIANVREHFTAEQIANKEYLQNTIPYRLQDITKVIDEGNYEGMSVDMDTIQLAITDMDKRLDMLDERLNMLEGKPPYYLCKEDLMRK